MALLYLSNLEAGQYFALAQKHAGEYSLSGGFRDAFNLHTVTVLSFVDMSTYVDATDKGELAWLANLRAIHGAYGASAGVLVMCVLYDNAADVANTANDYDTALSRAGYANYNDPGNSSEYLGYYIQRNDTWLSSAAKEYRTGLGTPDGAFTYILRKTAADTFRVTDKIHTGAASSSNGDPGACIGFSGWSPDYASLESFITRRIEDHLDETPAAAAVPTPALVRTGSVFAVEFPMKALAADSESSFVFKDGGGTTVSVIASLTHTEPGAAGYLAATPREKAELTLGDVSAFDGGTLTLTPAAALTAVSGRPFTFAPAVSCLVDTEPPTVPEPTTATPTSDATPTWTWPACADDTTSVTAYRARVVGDAAWTDLGLATSYTPAALTDGDHTVEVQARDGAGNWSASGTHAIVVDTEPPTVPEPTTATPTSDATPTWTWPACTDDTTSVTAYRARVVGDAAWTDLGLALSYTPAALTDGDHTVEVQARDEAGNWSASGTHTVVIVSATPAVTDVSSSAADNSYDAGTVLPISVAFTAAVTVAGAPRLALNSGASAYAAYAGGSGTATLTFRYTVAEGENTGDLDYRATGSLEPNGGSITAASGAAAALTLPAPGTPGSLGANKNIVIDTVRPKVVGVCLGTRRVALGTRTIRITKITFTERVVVPRQLFPPLKRPTVLSPRGLADVTLTYLEGSGSATLVFRLDVPDGTHVPPHLPPHLPHLGGAVALEVVSGWVRDRAGNDAILKFDASIVSECPASPPWKPPVIRREP